jgi:hypothetical protein
VELLCRSPERRTKSSSCSWIGLDCMPSVGSGIGGCLYSNRTKQRLGSIVCGHYTKPSCFFPFLQCTVCVKHKCTPPQTTKCYRMLCVPNHPCFLAKKINKTNQLHRNILTNYTKKETLSEEKKKSS